MTDTARKTGRRDEARLYSQVREQGVGPNRLPMPKDRMRRVNEAVREVLSVAINNDLKDPRIGFVTVTAVDTTPDLRHAHVHVSVLGDEHQRAESLLGLRSSHGFLQARLGAELRLRHTPRLEFHYDDSAERGQRISELLRDPRPQP
jgi:ribosome-binding factor A